MYPIIDYRVLVDLLSDKSLPSQPTLQLSDGTNVRVRSFDQFFAYGISTGLPSLPLKLARHGLWLRTSGKIVTLHNYALYIYIWKLRLQYAKLCIIPIKLVSACMLWWDFYAKTVFIYVNPTAALMQINTVFKAMLTNAVCVMSYFHVYILQKPIIKLNNICIQKCPFRLIIIYIYLYMVSFLCCRHAATVDRA